MSYTLIKVKDDGTQEHIITAPMCWSFEDESRDYPVVGDALCVSSMDRWYRTSLVQEIIEVTPNRIKFRTLNSIYIWEKNE